MACVAQNGDGVRRGVELGRAPRWVVDVAVFLEVFVLVFDQQVGVGVGTFAE